MYDSIEKSSKGLKYITNILCILNIIFIALLITTMCLNKPEYFNNKYRQMKDEEPRVEFVNLKK